LISRLTGLRPGTEHVDTLPSHSVASAGAPLTLHNNLSPLFSHDLRAMAVDSRCYRSMSGER
jgi:hypothetical protein